MASQDHAQSTSAAPVMRAAPEARINIGVTWFPHWMLCKAYCGRVPDAKRVLERNGWRFGYLDGCWRQSNRSVTAVDLEAVNGRLA